LLTGQPLQLSADDDLIVLDRLILLVATYASPAVHYFKKVLALSIIASPNYILPHAKMLYRLNRTIACSLL